MDRLIGHQQDLHLVLHPAQASIQSQTNQPIDQIGLGQHTLQAAGQEIKLEGSYSYQKTEEAPASLEGDQLNVFTATEEEWQSVIDEMSEKFQGILLTLMFQGGVQ